MRASYRDGVPRSLRYLHPSRRTRTGAGPEGMTTTTTRKKKAGGRRGLPQLALDESKAAEAFKLQVSNGEVEQWLEEDWCDAFMRGYYLAKAEHCGAIRGARFDS